MTLHSKVKKMRKNKPIFQDSKCLFFFQDVFVQGLAMYGIGELYEWGYLYDESFQRDIKVN